MRRTCSGKNNINTFDILITREGEGDVNEIDEGAGFYYTSGFFKA